MKSTFLKMLTLLLIAPSILADSTLKTFDTRREVQQFIQKMHQAHGLDPKKLTDLFKHYAPEPKILATMSKQFEALPWYQYQKHLITQTRIEEGVLFWKKNKAALKKAEFHFGVPASIIVAIIGVETSYGQRMGNYPLLQSLSTLAFDYPRRAAFFKEELIHFLLLAEEGSLNAVTAKGSFAGAIGIPQFMPSSYRRYAVDFSGNGKRDLIHNTEDAIGSVGNYLNKHGWKKNEAIAYSALASGTRYQSILSSRNKKPTLSLNDLAQHGVKLKNPKTFKPTSDRLKVWALDSSKTSKEIWVTLPNFSVIMKYNHSIHYALAVYQLSQEILKRTRGNA